MSQRLALIQESIKKTPSFVESSFDYFDFGSLLTPEQNKERLRIRAFLEKQIKQAIIPFVQKAKFPNELMPIFSKAGILQHFFDKPYGHGSSSLLRGVIAAELSRIDTGLSSFVVVQAGLLGNTIEILGSEEQKKKYLPKIINLEWIGGWGLTEDKVGSDASNISTTSTKVEEGYKLNGIKRWMGNGNKDLLVVWAKNTQTKQVEGYILETHNKPAGWKSQVIPNKLGIRIVENCNITLTDVFVSDAQLMPLAKDFQNGTNVILKHSRPYVCWIALGTCMGVYDNAIKYTRQRKQFGRPIAGFQLIQEKIARIMGNTQAIMALLYRLDTLGKQGKASMGQIALCKAWITQRGREVCRLGRQICGGNGLLHENYVMRALIDMEAIYTYEGTYEINSLVAGRDLTGLSAFTK